MIDKTPLPGLNINSDEAKTHINNFWSYLDDLAANNPEEYKKFIGNQMKKGITEHQLQQKALNKEIEVQPVLCLRFKPIKLIKDLDKDNDKDLNDPDIHIHDPNGGATDIKEVHQIKFAPEFQSDAFTTKVIQNRKIYLNVLKGQDYFPPTDDKGNFLSESLAQDVNNWRYIPTEFRYNGKKMSMTNTRCDFYDVILNAMVISKMKAGDEMYKSILGYICRKFAIFLNDKAELFLKSVKIIEGKIYKSIKPKPELFKVRAANVANKGIGQSTQSHAQGQVKAQPMPANVPVNVPGSEAKEDKKPLIQEIQAKSISKQIIPFTKRIKSPTRMEISFDFSEFDHLSGMNEIDLQISENGIIIHLDNPKYIIDENYEPIEMAFDCKMDPDQCKAKYNKKDKILLVTIVRIL